MKNKGFTLIELIVVIVIIGILAAIAIPRFMGAQDRARIGAAEAEVTKMRQAVGLFEIDYATYDLTKAHGGSYSTTDYTGGFTALLLQPDGTPYMDLPDTVNFNTFTYTGTDSTYTITVNAKDTRSTLVTGIPTKTYH
ncbi:MAG: prepilin-type N-terminal cleavage/methylation domain-containing protein [Candidatus Stahlbacteria bacterium]|nr:prepilin-type N-terminal cleavage/methylation domain-containing protein [Candidatus Stahlbacteria bacterium]